MSKFKPTGMSDQVLDSLFRACEIKDKPTIQHGLLEQFNVDYKNLPVSLPFNTYLELLEYLRQALFSDKSYDEGYMTFGELIIKGYLHGPTGTINRVALKVFSPEENLENFIKFNASLTPYLKYTIEEITKGYARYCFENHMAPPGIMGGMARSVLTQAGATDLKVTWHKPSPLVTIYELTWK